MEPGEEGGLYSQASSAAAEEGGWDPLSGWGLGRC